MPSQNSRTLLQIIITIGMIIPVMFVAGCVSSQNNEPLAPTINPTNVSGPVDERTHVALTPDTSSPADPIIISIHNITVYQMEQKSGNIFRLAVLDISLKNSGLSESFMVNNTSMGAFELDNERIYRVTPLTGMYQDKIHNPILNRSVSPGEEIRGEVGFELVQNAGSLMVFLKYPDWRIAGQVAIPEVTNGTSSITNQNYQKNLKLSVHSAVLKTSIPGFTASPGNRLAIINVSITNENPTDAVITSENLLILTEQGITFEHGGSHTTREIAKNFLYLPLTIKPGETISGPMFYAVKGGSRINKIVLTDNNGIINSLVDLNEIYQYE